MLLRQAKPKGYQQPPAARTLEGRNAMNPVDEQEKMIAGTTVLPALIQIQRPPSLVTAEKARKRRIVVLLDHPVSRHLGISSWLLAGVAVAAARPITAMIVGGVILIGLLIGAINSLRWLFGAK